MGKSRQPKGSREIRPGVWEVRVYVGTDPVTGKQHYVSRTVKGTSRDAEVARATMVVDREAIPVVATEGTLGRLCDEVVAHLEAHGRAATTIANYRRLTAAINAAPIGAIELRRLKARDLDRWYVELLSTPTVRGRRRSPNTVHHYHRFIHMVLNHALRWEYIDRNPASFAQPPEVHRVEIELPSDSAVLALIAAAAESRTPDMAIALQLLAALGCRRGEVCGLQWRDLDLATGLVRIRRSVAQPSRGELIVKDTKAHAQRRLSAGPQVLGLLTSWRFECEQRANLADANLGDEAFVLSDDPAGRWPWKPDRITLAHARLRAQIGETFRVHDLRHWNASVLLDQGEDVTVVASRLGHRDKAMTHNVYAHMRPAADARAGSIIDAALGGGH